MYMLPATTTSNWESLCAIACVGTTATVITASWHRSVRRLQIAAIMPSATAVSASAWRASSVIWPISVCPADVAVQCSVAPMPSADLMCSRVCSTATALTVIKAMLSSVVSAYPYPVTCATIAAFMPTVFPPSEYKWTSLWKPVPYLTFTFFYGIHRDPSKYTCQCSEGYSGDGYVCIEEQNCLNNPTLCDMNANCQSTNAGLVCVCNQGEFHSASTLSDSSCHPAYRRGMRCTSWWNRSWIWRVSAARSGSHCYDPR